MSAIQLEDWIRKDIHVLVKGMLLRKYNFPEDLALLDQDILEVELPNQFKIDVGWFPENDPLGRFIIRIYRHNRRDSVRSPIETVDPIEVARTIAQLAHEYSTPLPSHTIPVPDR